MSTACCTVYVFYLWVILCQLLVALCFLFMGDLVSTACCIVYVFYLRVILCQLLVALFMFSIYG